MPLFRNKNGSLEQIKETSFNLEIKIQKITEKNLSQIFNLEFVKTEFQLGRFRIDTVAFDSESSSFVIIEYKKGRDSGLFEQGLAYLEIMLDRGADFITEYNESLGKHLKKSDVDWSQSRIIFVSPSFNKNQKQAANLDLHIELWQVHSYQNDIVEYFPIQTNDTKTPMKIFDSKGNRFGKITKEIKTYDEEYHFQAYASDKTKEMYYEIKKTIMLLGDNIQLIFLKKCIAFKTNNNFVYVILKHKIVHVDLALKINEVEDSKEIIKDMDGIGHSCKGHSRITIDDRSQIPYMLGLVEQAYTKSIKK